MNWTYQEALADLRETFPTLSFRYDPQPGCLLAEYRDVDIYVSDPGQRGTATLKWEASYGDVDVLAETPVRAVRLLSRRAGLSLEGV